MLIWMTTVMGLATVAIFSVSKQMIKPLIESALTICELTTRDGPKLESRGTGVIRCFELPGLPSAMKERGS